MHGVQFSILRQQECLYGNVVFIGTVFDDTVLYPLAELPAGHLIQAQLVGIFIRGDVLAFHTYRISDIERLVDRKFAVVEQGVGSSRFFGLAARTASGAGRFTFTKVVMPAFTAYKSILPFHFGYKIQCFIAILEKYFG